MRTTSLWARAAGATLGTGALLVTIGCGTRDLNGVSAHASNASQTGQPVVVSCEPHQRTIVRPVVVNGTAMSQVECVATGHVAAAQPLVAQPQMALPQIVPAQPVYREVRAAQPVHADLGDARVVPAVYPSSGTARPEPARQVVYREPVKKDRSVKKSAVIIGSSAGVGAGVGAAVGGKKGALIGAAVGGGSAAIWDQVTRRND